MNKNIEHSKTCFLCEAKGPVHSQAQCQQLQESGAFFFQKNLSTEKKNEMVIHRGSPLDRGGEHGQRWRMIKRSFGWSVSDDAINRYILDWNTNTETSTPHPTCRDHGQKMKISF